MRRSKSPTVYLPILMLAAVFIAISAFTADDSTQSARPFSHPDRIRYDADCFTIDGKDLFIYSGAFHYFRCPKPLWRDRFQRIKDAGFNTVETYVAWNWHEPEMPANLQDFSKVNLTDLEDWLKMANQFGLYVIIRPGPYICAEWDQGGFPNWLLEKKPDGKRPGETWLRSDDPVFLAWCKHWYDAVCPVIAKYQLTRQPPGHPGVILMQLENEYDFAGFSDDVRANQVKALAKAALANGIDIPLFTCWTHVVRGNTDPLLRHVYDSYNTYPRWDVDSIQKEVQKLRREQPDAPLTTTELQGGWFSQVGGKLSEEQDGITASQINNLTLFAIQNGETLLNYYMLFGGTNPGDRGARNITTTYDYNAPIREWGGVGDRYQRVHALANMLREHGARLARAEQVDCDVEVPQKDVTVVERRAQDGGRYLFVRTSQHTEPRTGTAHVKENADHVTREIIFNYDLEPFGSKVLYLPPGVNDAVHGEWLPKPVPAIERPTNLPSPVTITSALHRDDPGPLQWHPMSAGQMLDQLGIYNSQFVFYRAKLDGANTRDVVFDHPDGDGVLALANGKLARPVGETGAASYFHLPTDISEAVLLYENLGHPNGGGGMEQRDGISSAHTGEALTLTGWRKKKIDSMTDRPEVQPDFKDDDWTPIAVKNMDASDLKPNTIAVYRARVEVTADNLKGGNWTLNVGRADDRGIVYVNGINVGETTEWSRPYSFDVTRQLLPGTNVIAVIVHNIGGNGGLGMSGLGRTTTGDTVQLESFGSPAGVEQRWWEPKLKLADWKPVQLGGEASSSAPEAILSWYRMNFSLPALTPHVWVPWHVRLHATGNGFLYLNGHAIGRYWEAGPQHDFFLPECWLNFGKGKKNNLTLSLRPLEQGAEIQSAVVEPYAEFAENR